MQPTRREIVRMLTALGVSTGALTAGAQQDREPFTARDLEGALAIAQRELPPAQMELLRRALQQNLQEFERVRSLDLDDRIGLPVVFKPKPSAR
jgi:hypothetical protein